VALDASRESLAALEAAVRVAARLNAELAGVFVEDIDLFNLAALPFARAFGLTAGQARKLDPESVEREWRNQAAAARRALEQAAAAMQVPWSFRVARGKVQAELMAAALEADLVALGKALRPLTRRRGLGSTTRALVGGAPIAVLLAGEDKRGDLDEVMVVYDGEACSRRALDIAAGLARRDGGNLTILLAGDREALKLEVMARLEGLPLALTFRSGDSGRLAEHLASARPGFLVVGEDCLTNEGQAVADLAESAHCPVLLVRTAPEGQGNAA
jgi:nucleotide-binding universal stress UspA family protein